MLWRVTDIGFWGRFYRRFPVLVRLTESTDWDREEKVGIGECTVMMDRVMGIRQGAD